MKMIPTISVTPQSSTLFLKYSTIFDDTLNQLQNIRETVVQMKNSSHISDNLSISSNNEVLSSSLPDLSSNKKAFCDTSFSHLVYLSTTQKNTILNDRRNSWTTTDDIDSSKYANKSISLSSLDSEDDNVKLLGHRRRSGRNSAGGISTHSLNEAELMRHLDLRIHSGSIASEIKNRLPLQKSISTSSIVVKDDKSISRHLTDSEDENQGLLRGSSKIQSYENAEKRRKRGSLFFRKKKEKMKTKSPGNSQESIICEYCGSHTKYSSKEHQLYCKTKKSFYFKSFALNVRKGQESFLSNDTYDGCGTDQASQVGDDSPLIKADFFYDSPTDANDLGVDCSLGISLQEHDSWSPGVPKDILSSLKECQIKRQEHIYEFIMTEKHHCQTLLVIQKIFVESIERNFPAFHISNMFPRLNELITLHTNFLKKLREKQRENSLVDSIADILLDFFSYEKAQKLRLAYGEFCANHRAALEQFKTYMTTREQNFVEWYKHCLTNPLLKKKGIPECILFVTQRLTKYPLLIEPLLKSAKDDVEETEKLKHALTLVKGLLIDVDSCVAEKELRERQIDIFQRIDNKSFAIYKNKPFRKYDFGIDSRRNLKFEGLATLMQGRSKMQNVLVAVLTDCLCFFCENSGHNKYTFFTPEHKAGVVPLQKLLIREKAGAESRGIYIISSNPAFPEMYELKVQKPKDKNVWIQSIRQAVLDCPSSEFVEAQNLTCEGKSRLEINKRELLEKIRQKDIEMAILLEEKLNLQINLFKGQFENVGESALNINESTIDNTSSHASTFLSSFASYKELITPDVDMVVLWKHVQDIIQEITQLACTIYSASTGLALSRSNVPPGGEKSFDASLTLPKRAETFAGFDEKRGQRVFFPKTSTLQFHTSHNQDFDGKMNFSVRLGERKYLPMADDDATNSEKQPLTFSSELNNDYSFATLKITHHLQTLLSIISQQLTTIHSLQLQMGLFRDSLKSTHVHNDQLEELRNLQDKLQEEKICWLKTKEQQEQELNEVRLQQQKVQDAIKAQEEDIKNQREQLYRKMEFLSNQGLLLSPNTPLLLNPMPANILEDCSQENPDVSFNLYHTVSLDSSAGSSASNNTSGFCSERRKKRTASIQTNVPPVNLISATNAPKIKHTNVKQKIPIKLSSLSSNSLSNASNLNKMEKTTAVNSSPSINVVQVFPYKLEDKRSSIPVANPAVSPASIIQPTIPQIIPSHVRTGSSPAIIQNTNSHQNKFGIKFESNSPSLYEKVVAGACASTESFDKAYVEKSPNKEVCRSDDEIYF